MNYNVFIWPTSVFFWCQKTSYFQVLFMDFGDKCVIKQLTLKRYTACWGTKYNI